MNTLERKVVKSALKHGAQKADDASGKLQRIKQRTAVLLRVLKSSTSNRKIMVQALNVTDAMFNDAFMLQQQRGSRPWNAWDYLNEYVGQLRYNIAKILMYLDDEQYSARAKTWVDAAIESGQLLLSTCNKLIAGQV